MNSRMHGEATCLYGSRKYRIIINLRHLLWILARPVFRILEKTSTQRLPDQKGMNCVYITSSKDNEEVGRFNHGLATRSWLLENLCIKSLIEIEDIYQIPSSSEEQILVITNSWLWRHADGRAKFGAVIRQAFFLRKNRTKVWIFSGDPCDIQLVFIQAILVCLAGGATISQTVDYKALRKFGIPHPYGPLIWMLTRKSSCDYYSGLPVSERSKICILAMSGDPERISYMEKLKPKIEDLGYEIVGTNHDITLGDYINLTKSSRISITTSKFRKNRTPISIFYKNGPKIQSTLRVLEGFAAGCVVITTPDDTLRSLGFVPNVHYLEFIEEDASIQPLVEATKFNNLDQIATDGREHFLKLVDLGIRNRT